MHFLVDECTGTAVARWLEEKGHDVFSVYDDAPGIADTEVIRRAHEEGCNNHCTGNRAEI